MRPVSSTPSPIKSSSSLWLGFWSRIPGGRFSTPKIFRNSHELLGNSQQLKYHEPSHETIRSIIVGLIKWFMEKWRKQLTRCMFANMLCLRVLQVGEYAVIWWDIFEYTNKGCLSPSSLSLVPWLLLRVRFWWCGLRVSERGHRKTSKICWAPSSSGTFTFGW